MKKELLLAKLLVAALTPFYVIGYGITKLFNVNEKMLTISEWFSMFKKMKYNEEYETVECEI